MPTEFVFDMKQFGGLKNDEESKQVPFNFFYRMNNFNYPDDGLLGVSKILLPSRIKQIGTSAIDGLYEFRYLNASNTLVTENIAVTNGGIYKDALAVSPTLLKSGLTAGKVFFATYKDKLFIANGKNYVNVYYGALGVVAEMGAPAAVVSAAAGNPNGVYYYAMTYVTSGGEEVLGSVSNTVTASSKQVTLTLPIGYDGTTSRKIYRTAAGGSTLKLLATVADNTTMTYTDNVADGSLGASIPATNNELPKPYALAVAGEKLFGTVVDKYPTQVFPSDVNIEVWDSASYIDVSNFGNDNTPVAGIGEDFNKIVVGTGKNILLIDPSDNSVVVTRVNVGFKNRFAIKKVPAFGEDFPGGLMFVSTLNDVRLLNGLQQIPVVNTIDNIRSDNWAQNIRGDINRALRSFTDIYCEFYENKWHLVIDDVKYVFDIRTQRWTYNNIRTASYHSQPKILAILGNYLYNGQPDGWIEQEYASATYRTEDVVAFIESPEIAVDDKYKFMQKLIFWILSGSESDISLQAIVDSNEYFPINASFTTTGGAFDSTYFNSTYFETGGNNLDYKVLNVNSPCRWLKYKLTVSRGNIGIKGITAIGNVLNTKTGVRQ